MVESIPACAVARFGVWGHDIEYQETSAPLQSSGAILRFGILSCGHQRKGIRSG
jgi:hypothetical protein